MSILEAVARAERPLRAAEIMDTCQLPRATVHRICTLLCQRGYLHQQTATGGYTLGAEIIDFANLVQANQTHSAYRHAILESVAQEVGETCNIAVPDGTAMVYRDRVETKWPLRHQLPIGARVPLHCTANGKLYLSTLGEAQRDRLLKTIALDKLTKNTLTRRRDLDTDIARIAESDVSTDDEEFIEGMIAIAVPIRDKVGRFVAGLAIHAPVVRLKLKDALAYVPVLRSAAEKLGSNFSDSGTL
jgi:IclR family acetate operon transcriptional repressor